MASSTTLEQSVESCIFPLDSYITGFRCLWTIHDYMEVKRQRGVEENLQMKYLLNLSFEKTCKCRAVIFPNGRLDEEKTELYFGYDKDETDFKEMWFVFKLSLLNGDKQPTLSKEVTRGDTLNDPTQWWNIIKLQELSNDPNKYLVNGSLIILLEGAVSTKMNAGGGKVEMGELLKNRLSNLCITLNQLKSQSLYSDVSFSVGDEQFELHKMVLANRSEVFDEMFKNKKEVNIIPVKDLAPSVFRELVHFIYTNSVTHNFHENGLELLEVAAMYKVTEMKRLCEVNLLNSIAVDNAAVYFITAHTFSANELKTRTAEFIRENWEDVQKTDGWKELKNNPELFFYLMDASISTR